ncbi:MAG: sigma-70 family RNA polymerase sigma factor [Kiritimatiellae bacterium]|nr:sigma-70 family RNA polymerase sigma factor [Kiritimatiellia bacterium]
MRTGESRAMELYMREIGTLPLLTREEEVELSGRIRRGDDEARQKMMRANLRLVVKIARDYADLGLPLLDLISEGNIGLAKAVDRFESGRGAKFSTYAAWWIKQAIKHALSRHGRMIRLPAHQIVSLSRLRRATQELAVKLNREPTDDEIARHMGITASDVTHWRALGQRTSSLDTPLNENGGVCLIDIMPDDGARTPYDVVSDTELRTLAIQMIRSLTPREQEILKRRYGLGGTKKETLDTVGSRLGLTRERVRQIQAAATVKLRTMLENDVCPRDIALANAG